VFEVSIAAVLSLPPVGPAVVNVSKSNLSVHTSAAHLAIVPLSAVVAA
jgi:hypothetical protein